MLNLNHLGHAGHRSAVIMGFWGIVGVNILVDNHIQIYIEMGVNFVVIREGQVGDL